jgi:hypothetical protein
LEQVGRSRLRQEIDTFPGRPNLFDVEISMDFAAETQKAGRQKRDAHNLIEYGLIPMPADAGAGAVFSYQDLLQSFRFELREQSRSQPEFKQKVRNFFRFP